MTRFLTALLVCLFAVTAEAAPMPWKTFSGKMVSESTGANLIGCQQGEILVASFKHGHDVFGMVFEPASGLIAFVYHPKGQKLPAEIGFGYVDLKTPGAHDVIPVITWEKYDPRNPKHGASICQSMFPHTT